MNFFQTLLTDSWEFTIDVGHIHKIYFTPEIAVSRL